jgi:hypothetical protein
MRTFAQGINPATALMVDAILFVVPTGAEYEVVEAIEAHTVAGSDGSAVTCNLRKASAGTAPGSGTSVLASTFDLKSTANTPVAKNTGSGLSTSETTRTLRSGQMLSMDLSGTLTALAGFSLTVVLALKRKGTYRGR